MVVRHRHPDTHPPDHLSNLDTGSDAALCTDSMVVGENKSLIIMSRITSDKLESGSYGVFLQKHIYRVKPKGSLKLWPLSVNALSRISQ